MQTESWQPELVHDTVGTGDAEDVMWRLKDEGASHHPGKGWGLAGGEGRREKGVGNALNRVCLDWDLGHLTTTSLILCCRTHCIGSPVSIKGQF